MVALIVAFWLGSTGWLAYREWWRWLGAESPPPINAELADEAIPQSARWRIFRGGADFGHATSSMKFLKNSTVELETTIDRLRIDMGVLALPIDVQKGVTTQRLTPEGQLLSLASELVLRITFEGGQLEIPAQLEGAVRDGKLYPRCRLGPFTYSDEKKSDEKKSDEKKKQPKEVILEARDLVLDPIELASGSMINPLQPLPKMVVKPGQKWQITHVDPLLAATYEVGASLLGDLLNGPKNGARKIGALSLLKPKPMVIRAEVLSEPMELIHQDKAISCYVIEYQSTDFKGRTWVQVDNGKVLLQELDRHGDKMTLRRED